MTHAFDPAFYGKVAVLCGGRNSEREISLQSGAAVCQACGELGIDFVRIDISSDPIADIQRVNPNWAFNVLHGGIGENGYISALLELLDIRYCSSGAVASSLAMNKVFSKRIWRDGGLPTPKFIEVHQSITDIEAQVENEEMAFPLVVKPVDEGSSIGVTFANDIAQLQMVVSKTLQQFNTVLIEQCVNHREVTVGILGETALPVIRIETAEDFYDYRAKYTSNSTKMHIPSGLDKATEKQVQHIARQAYKLLGCRIWARVDILIDTDNKPYLLELNTLPGMTSHSLLPYAAQAAGFSFSKLIERIFTLAKEAYTT